MLQGKLYLFRDYGLIINEIKSPPNSNLIAVAKFIYLTLYILQTFLEKRRPVENWHFGICTYIHVFIRYLVPFDTVQFHRRYDIYSYSWSRSTTRIISLFLSLVSKYQPFFFIFILLLLHPSSFTSKYVYATVWVMTDLKYDKYLYACTCSSLNLCPFICPFRLGLVVVTDMTATFEFFPLLSQISKSIASSPVINYKLASSKVHISTALLSY